MERMVLEAQARPSLTKGQRHQLRGEDKVLAVIYGKGDDTLPLVLDGRSLRQVLTTGGSNVLIDLAVKAKGKKTRQETVMFRDIQRDMIYHDRILHVDFIRISMTDKIEVAVHLNFTGEPVGVSEGGVVSLPTREVLIKCLPADIPEQFDIDISDLNIGDSITAESINLGSAFELITPPDTTLAQVLAPMAEEELEPAVEEELEEGEEAAGEEVTEEEPAEEETEEES
ncbi:MAG: 50S ribosomal protein L25 [Bacillota bacterium]|jgi:large subunit ribosomal protein L25|nr:50S ribosomal protein L25 [Bacillota bacterium]